MPRTITSPELLPLIQAFQGDFLDVTTGFVRVHKLLNAQRAEKSNLPRFDFDIGGSGTLITAAGVRAILTADHVLSKFPEGDPFGLVVLNRTGRHYHHKIITSAIGRVPIPRGADESKGPDLGLLVLSPTDANDLEATGKVFYNVSKRRNRMLNEAPALDKGCAWILCGLFAEWSKEIPPERGFQQAKEFRGSYGPVSLVGHREEGEFDYLSVQVRYDGEYAGPQSYGGCSGGSLWQALLKEREGAIVIDELLLAGVPFYQSPHENNRRTIECHGRKSIYEAAVKALEHVA